MVWVDADKELEGGGTEFPHLRRGSDDAKWCELVDCATGSNSTQPGIEGTSEGVVFKPVPGNAVYWENFRSDGSDAGYGETWHAGLPVIKGTKVGLNIWSWGRIE
jgi:prolyl 4-hydroxylase